METCYRHPSRETGVSCSSCGRPICTECMTSTPVGMRCPECARERTRVAPARAGMAREAGEPVATFVLIALNVIVFLAELGGGGSGTLQGGGSLIRDGGLLGPAISDQGEYYRIVSSGFLHAGFLHLALNMFVLFILGRLLEPAIGTVRFLGVYFVSLLAGAFGALLLDPGTVTVGASGAIYGVMGATILIARRRGVEEIASQIGIWLVLNLVISFSISGISIGGHLGGLAGGLLCGLVISVLERRAAADRRAVFLEAACMFAIAAISVGGALWAAGQPGL
ncbi:MAG: rhomboid family intramembrane serine protease [Solirubrobacterales bacterium]|nr:rhomboid family intramembrane serine protease [Solirubrobacterales bacterium]